MKPLIWAVILSILPVSELRGGIPYAVLNGISPVYAFSLCVLANILIIPVIFFFLDYINKFLLKIGIWRRFFVGYLNRKVKKVQEKYVFLSYFVLFLFVAVPAPGTGAYTGSLLAWFFKLERKRSFVAIATGVIVAGIITTILTVLGKTLWELL